MVKNKVLSRFVNVLISWLFTYYRHGHLYSSPYLALTTHCLLRTWSSISFSFRPISLISFWNCSHRLVFQLVFYLQAPFLKCSKILTFLLFYVCALSNVAYDLLNLDIYIVCGLLDPPYSIFECQAKKSFS